MTLSSEVRNGVVLSVGLRSGVYFGEGERVCDFQYAVLLHADYAARRERGEGFPAGGSDLDRDLRTRVSLP